MLKYLISLLFSLHMGLATNFAGHDDPGNPIPWASCLHRDLRDSDMVVASKTIPCLTKVWIYCPRTGRSVVAQVGDWGPRHANLDLNVAVTQKLRANGAESIIYTVLN